MVIVGALTPTLLQFRGTSVSVMRLFGNGTSLTLTPVVALLVFGALDPGSTIGWPSLIDSFMATFCADVTTFVFIVVIRRLLDSYLRWGNVLLTFGYTTVAGMAVSSLGLLSVAAMSPQGVVWLVAGIRRVLLVVCRIQAYV